jgi:hypothetical protein
MCLQIQASSSLMQLQTVPEMVIGTQLPLCSHKWNIHQKYSKCSVKEVESIKCKHWTQLLQTTLPIDHNVLSAKGGKREKTNHNDTPLTASCHTTGKWKNMCHYFTVQQSQLNNDFYCLVKKITMYVALHSQWFVLKHVCFKWLTKYPLYWLWVNVTGCYRTKHPM